MVSGTADALVLGSRDFMGSVPFRSRFGNAITHLIFALSTGHHIADTRTGLRAYPAGMLEWLQTLHALPVRLGFPIVASKLATETLLFIGSFLVQRRVIFVDRSLEPADQRAPASMDA